LQGIVRISLEGSQEELELDFSSISHLIRDSGAKTADLSQTVPQERTTIVTLKKMIADSGVTQEEVQKVVTARGHYKEGTTINEYTDDFITRWIVPNWKKVVETIKNENGGK